MTAVVVSEPEGHVGVEDAVPGFIAASLGAPGTVADDVEGLVQGALEGVHTEGGVHGTLEDLGERKQR